MADPDASSPARICSSVGESRGFSGIRPRARRDRRRIVEQSLELYTCSGAAGADSETPAEARNGTLPRSYNELATLMSVTGASELLFPGCAERVRNERSTYASRGAGAIVKPDAAGFCTKNLMNAACTAGIWNVVLYRMLTSLGVASK